MTQLVNKRTHSQTPACQFHNLPSVHLAGWISPAHSSGNTTHTSHHTEKSLKTPVKVQQVPEAAAFPSSRIPSPGVSLVPGAEPDSPESLPLSMLHPQTQLSGLPHRSRCLDNDTANSDTCMAFQVRSGQGKCQSSVVFFLCVSVTLN